DGVLSDIVAQIVRFAHRRFGVSLSRESFTSENAETCTSLSRHQLVELFTSSDFYRTMPCMSEAKRLLQVLTKHGATVHIITDRFWYPEIQEDTRYWLGKNHLVFDSLHFVRKTEKQRKAKELGIEWFIEDQISNAVLISSECDVVLVDRPYNRGLLPTRVVRVERLEEASRMILGCIANARALGAAAAS
ncbi:MAG: 5' nucleotidase, NT5C type, partial [Terriglobales bacterium]